jgi:hypothetical protein
MVLNCLTNKLWKQSDKGNDSRDGGGKETEDYTLDIKVITEGGSSRSMPM